MKRDIDRCSRVRIAVLGKMNVGKSALTVRFLTKRFIGEYRSKSDLLYKKTIYVNESSFDVEIMDVSSVIDWDRLPVELLQWSDAIILVYSITDRDSFIYAETMLNRLQKLADCPPPHVVLVGNKTDLKVGREVFQNEGKAIAEKYGCTFFESSVSECNNNVQEIFETIFRDMKSPRSNAIQRLRKFSISKMITLLFGKEFVKTPSSYSPSLLSSHSGTLIVLHKDKLSSSRSLK